MAASWHFGRNEALVVGLIGLVGACSPPDSAGGPSPGLRGVIHAVVDEPAREGRVQASRAALDGGRVPPRIHYLNFSDGTTVLTKGKADDAPNNVSAICGTAPLAFPKWEGTEADKLEMARNLQRLWAPYNIIVTLERPAEGDYSMEMVGPAGNGCDFDGNVAGVAILDCNDTQKRNVTFTFAGGYVTTAQEAAHSLGLEHTQIPCDVMAAGYAVEACRDETWGYPDQEAPILDPRCGRKSQNSHRRMLAMLGPWPDDEPRPDAWAGTCPDDGAPPRVSIRSPKRNADVPSEIQVTVDARDDCAGLARARLTVPARKLVDEIPGGGPYSWDLSLDPGVVDIVVEAWDANGNRGESSVRVRVGGVGDVSAPLPAPDDEPSAPLSLSTKSDTGCSAARTPARPSSALPWCAALLVLVALSRRRAIR